ncbi:MAG: helix-turn-helix domain-containing protein [Lachnospiraceae bacterium]|nr:helix-turn-helix domain-containing protein [Lachnospiraceae bacterium]
MSHTISEREIPERQLIGVRIREVRRKRGFTCEGLALQAGTTGGYIRQIESIRSPKLPSIDILIRICNVLGASPNYLLQDQLKNNIQDEHANYVAMWENLPPEKQALINVMIKTLAEQED